ncbi:uncharacterized protein I303_103240 [Kwoniella dejecticola CBS 10117]|uniref:Peptidase C19 ubiquitin carboxyl-terminal hydrolase domain-containing protein n=1 Tax=Kwoniella dejecticola CBS 10117 TaxID=1296121 RepID=A0AAJ8KNG5_9TREE
MSVHDATYNALKEMGIDPVIAREAASRYHSVEPAVNWCFSDGATWTPQPTEAAGPPSYDSWRPQRAHGTSVEHREVADLDAPSSAEATPSPNPPSPQFASNNPFRQNPHPPPPLPKRNIAPAPQPTDTWVDYDETDANDDEDEELRKTIAMSRGEVKADDGRQERERSVRATGPPPPSPSGNRTETDDLDDQSENLNSLFGPSNKDDVDGKLSLVPASQNNTSSMSKEDEDMDRAIQESLMTASFHSASALKDSNRPQPTERREGAPVVLYSESGHSTYAANFFQAMYAVPQLREAVAGVLASNLASEPSSKGKIISQIYEASGSSTSSFTEVDDQMRELRNGREPNQLPPNQPGVDLHCLFVNEMTDLVRSQAGTTPATGTGQALTKLDPRLFQTLVDGDPPQRSSFVTFSRSNAISPDIYSHLAQLLWNTDSSSQSLVELGDVLTVMLEWSAGAKREIWKLDERVVLDRFMKSNATYAAQKRAHQSVMAGNARRTQEKIDRLTTHEGNDYQRSISALIEHLDNSPPTKDHLQNESRQEMTDKLDHILKVLQQKVSDLKAELEENSQAASSSLFETDKPEYNQHVYVLRGILFHDGALVGGNHLYSYVCGEDGRWWKIQEHEIESVEWETIGSDKTGLWMDGGAYMLVYSREGPRPAPPSPDFAQDRQSQSQLQSQTQIESSSSKTVREPQLVPEGDLIDISMNSSVTSTRQGTPDTLNDVDMRSTTTLADDPIEEKPNSTSTGNLVDLE